MLDNDFSDSDEELRKILELEVDGDRSYPNPSAVPEPIDVVDVFRHSTYLGEVVEEAMAVGARVLWAQLDVVSTTQEPVPNALFLS